MISAFRQLFRNMPFYAVAKGRTVGVFLTWPECQRQVNGFHGAKFKKFATRQQAEGFIRTHNGDSEDGSSSSSLTSASSDSASNSSVDSQDSHPSIPPVDSVRVLIDNYDEINAACSRIESLKRELDELRGSSVAAGTSNSGPRPAKRLKGESLPKPVTKMQKYGRYSFLEDDEGYVHVYTDGSCEGNGTAAACAGLGVYFGEGHALNVSKPVSGRPTNNCGEIQAASLAVRLAKENGVKRLMINTDSKFLIDSITKWVKGWKRNNWKLATGKPVKNEIDFKELDRELADNKIEVKWNHVDAHCGILGNERADALAREGSAMYREQKNSRR
ncbi:ribonuclease H1-like [Uranotaenia lowii]|uniref:ribonuclease H1-like n=1 Tax=Uranotaenia lowii TaxID=190385 RepID=UPI0024792FAE|nr:ribonuclease H1-like [Uranotaenia lowii]XP_055597811.1 ribonuclease H1-like [Uranotaenia lowii]